MKTFKLEIALDIKAVVPDSFIMQMRGDARDPITTTPFLQRAQEMFPNAAQDEDFILHILKHGVRHHARASLAQLFEASGLGCTLSPARAVVIDRSPPPEEAAVLASEIDAALSGGGWYPEAVTVL